MFLLWGSYKFNKHYGVKNESCVYCKRTSFSFVRSATWFWLFFIPLFPYYIQYSKVCNTCGYSIKLSKKQFFDQFNNPEPIKSESDVFDNQESDKEVYSNTPAEEPEDIMMRELVIIRKKKVIGCGMKVNIHIDNTIRAVVQNGQTVSIALDNKKHNLFATAGAAGVTGILRSNIILLENSAENKVFCLDAGINLILTLQENKE